jgi:hypothetical protein
LFQRAPGDSHQRGKSSLRKAGFDPRFSCGGFWLYNISASATALDFVDTIQQLLPDIPAGFMLIQCFLFSLGVHLQTCLSLKNAGLDKCKHG